MTYGFSALFLIACAPEFAALLFQYFQLSYDWHEVSPLLRRRGHATIIPLSWCRSLARSSRRTQRFSNISKTTIQSTRGNKVFTGTINCRLLTFVIHFWIAVYNLIANHSSLHSTDVSKPLIGFGSQLFWQNFHSRDSLLNSTSGLSTSFLA